jgi:hypothetical protein
MILDNYNPNWVWYAGGIICALAIAGFYALHVGTRQRLGPCVDEAQAVPAAP